MPAHQSAAAELVRRYDALAAETKPTTLKDFYAYELRVFDVGADVYRLVGSHAKDPALRDAQLRLDWHRRAIYLSVEIQKEATALLGVGAGQRVSGELVEFARLALSMSGSLPR